MNPTKREAPVLKPGQRWGILGGAFDPIHFGHLNLASHIQQRFGLRGVLLVASANPPHRDTLILSPYNVRLEMTCLAAKNFQDFWASRIEYDMRLSGYTIDTLVALHSENPGVSFDLIVGADQARVFDTWHQPLEILKLSRLLVGARPGNPIDIPEGLDRARIELCPTTELDLSSSDIRRRVRAGISESDLVAMVSAPVAEYIIRHKLYQS